MIEQMLRLAPDVKRIYVVIREKGTATGQLTFSPRQSNNET